MKKTYAYRKSKIFGRLGAILMDVLIAFLVMVFLLMCVVLPIFNQIPAYKNVNQAYEDKLISFRIYQKDESGIGYITSNYDESLIYFFDTYTEDGIENYNNIKKESDCFVYDEITSSYKVVENCDSVALTNFYNNALKKANEFVWAREDVLTIAYRLELLNQVVVYISLMLSCVVVFLIPPLILKDRITFGMIMFHFQTISNKTGVEASRLQILFKFLIFISFEVLLSYFFIGFGFMALSMLMVLFTSEKTSLTDFLCSTVVVDKMGYDSNTPEKELIYIDVIEGEEVDEK